MGDQHDYRHSIPYDSYKGCPRGYHKRSAYKTRKGTYVPARCVHSTTHHAESSAEFKKKHNLKMTRRLKLHIPSIKSLARRDCPPGMIPRKAYVRKYSTAVQKKGFTVKKSSGVVYKVKPTSKNIEVKSKCVKDVGLPGKGPRSGKGIGPLHKGELAQKGYSVKNETAKRHNALGKAVNAYGPLGVYRKLNAVGKLTMRTLPKMSRRFMDDRNWVKSKYGPIKAFNRGSRTRSRSK
jgi:hypothetical protein